jgi:hypothetical protein
MYLNYNKQAAINLPRNPVAWQAGFREKKKDFSSIVFTVQLNFVVYCGMWPSPK